MTGAYYEDGTVTLHHGNALTVAPTLASGSVQSIITSPPYFGLRDYGTDEQFGAEGSVAEFVANLVSLFRELREVLTDDGTLWLNLGDSYTGARGGPQGSSGEMANRAVSQHRQGVQTRLVDGLASKNLIGVPWRVAFALQDDGWILRSDIIWHKPNPMPESVSDRPTKAHEYLFLFAKSPRYYYDADAVREDGSPVSAERYASGYKTWGRNQREASQNEQRKAREYNPDLVGRNKRTVWSVATVPFSEAHFAVYPPELIRPCVLAGSRPGDTILDPFSGSGTTGMVATQEGRKFIGIDLNKDYLDLSLRTRFAQPVLDIGSIS